MSKKMGFWSVIALVFGSQIGSGIFILPQSLAPFGIFGLYGWFFAGFGAVLLAIVFAELCSRFPKTGGPHTYVGEAFGQLSSFFIGWAYWLVSWVSSSVVVIASVAYLTPVIGEMSSLTNLILEIALLLIITWVNCRSVELSGKLEFVLTLLKFIPFVVVPAILLSKFDASNIAISEKYACFSDLKLANFVTVLCFWCFIGVECATTPAEAVENPSKTIPRAIILGTTCVAIIYFINNAAIMGVIPSGILASANAPFVDAISIVMGKNTSILMSLIASIVCIGTLNAWVLTSAQISLGLSQDKLLPEMFAKKNKRDAPSNSVMISCLGMIPILMITKDKNLAAQIDYIIGFSVKSFLIIYAFCSLALLKFTLREKKIFKSIIGICSIAFCALMLIESSLESIMISSLFFLSGFFMLPFVKNKKTDKIRNKST